MLRKLSFTLAWLSARTRREREMADELRHHCDAYAADLERSGVPADEALRRAAIQFGSIEAVKEECREAVKTDWADEFLRNVRYALRGMRTSPGYTFAVVATLAICIGANTAIYSIVDAVMFRPLPFRDPERLAQVVLRVRMPNGRLTDTFLNTQTGLAWSGLQDAKSFTVAASRGSAGVNLSARRKTSYVQQQRVSAGYFHVLGVELARGREFAREEDVPGGAAVTILSHGLWQNLFGGDPNLLGSAVQLSGEPHVVVGIMPPDFRPTGKADVWTPLRATVTGEGGGNNYNVIARLRSDVNWAQARVETEALGEAIARTSGVKPERAGKLELRPLQESRVAAVRRPLLLLWSTAGLVLLIGCVNVAGLMLARSSIRMREIGTRVALGSGSAAVMRQLITESAVLAGGGALAALGLAYVAMQLLGRVAQTFGVWQEIRLDWRVACAAVLLTLLTTIATGLAPALQAVRVDVRSALEAAGSRGVTGGRRRMGRKALVVVQLAFGVTLLAGAGLLLRTLEHLHRLEPGFDGKGVLTASVSLHDARYRTSERVSWLYDRTLQRIRSTPGVESAAVGLHVPYEPWLNAAVDVRDGVVRDTVRPTAMNYVTPGYLAVLRIPVLSGRGIDERDVSAGAPVALVNRTFVRTYLGDREPLGTYIRVRMDGAERLIVGVIGDVQQQPTFGVRVPIGAAIPAVFVPAAQLPSQVFELVHRWFSPQWVVRGGSEMALMRASIESALRETDPTLPVASFDTFDSVREEALRVQRLQAVLLSAFAFIAVLLAAVGVHGLMAQNVVERTREMGIRMALGATLREILGSAVAPGFRLAALGTILGLAMAAGCSRMLTSFLYGVAPTDPATFAVVAAILLGVAVAASAVAALRLLRLDPALTLRQE